MNVQQKLIRTILQFTPTEKSDPLINSNVHLGKPINRVDGKLKVTGKALYSAEYPLKDLSHAAMVYSSIAKGRITKIDVDLAKTCDGVIAILTHENMPKMEPPPEMDAQCGDKGSSPDQLPVMQDNLIHWNGQPVALIVAETLEQAEHAASCVKVEYHEEKSKTSFEKAKANAVKPPTVMGEEPEVKIGDAEKELKSAFCAIDEIYPTQRQNHNAIELHATIAWFKETDELLVFDTTQNLHALKTTLAKCFRLSPDSVDIICPFVGGAFGGKGAMWQPTQICVAAAKHVSRPVKLVVPREGVFRTVGGRTLSEQRVALGVNTEKQLVSVIHQGVTAKSVHGGMVEPFSLPARFLYQSKSYLIGQKVVQLDSLANTFMRAPGESIGSFALESAIDELANKVGVDPIELRLLNEPEKDPIKGNQFSMRHLKEVYSAGAKKFNWKQVKPRSQENGEWLIGQGVATATYPYNRFQGTAALTLKDNGHVSIRTATHEMGMGTATVQIQHAAERLGLDLNQISFEYGNTNLPQSPGAGGSNQTASVAASISVAVEKLVKELLAIASRHEDSPFKSAKENDVVLRNGGMYLKSDILIGLSYQSILTAAGLKEVTVEERSAAPMERMKYAMHSYGAQFCEVKVSKITGEVRITRWLGAFDAGKILNRKTAESQFRGGIIMGIGLALMEETLFDDRYGRITNASMSEYHVPVHLDIPKIEIIYLDKPDPHAPIGAHGIGEIGITGAAAAVANAVFNATGIRVRDLPITLDKLLVQPDVTPKSVG